MGLETHSSDGSAPCWVAQNLQPHPQEKHWRGSLAKCCLQRGIVLPHSCEAWLQTNSQKALGMAIIHWGTCYRHQRKIPKYCITASSGGFEYGIRVDYFLYHRIDINHCTHFIIFQSPPYGHNLTQLSRQVTDSFLCVSSFINQFCAPHCTSKNPNGSPVQYQSIHEGFSIQINV